MFRQDRHTTASPGLIIHEMTAVIACLPNVASLRILVDYRNVDSEHFRVFWTWSVEELKRESLLMAGTLNAQKALIFRITHRANIPWILKNGLHASSSEVLDPNFRPIGNTDLINKRSSRSVKVGPKGMLSDYIPFYFTPFSIMMFNIHTGYNVARVPNDEIVILVSSLHRVAELGIPFVFTNQHAYPKFAGYFTDISELDEIPWAQLNGRDFKHDPDDPGKKERYQAEALIWQHVPIEALLGICCHSDVVNQTIQAQITKRKLKLTSQVQKVWYF